VALFKKISICFSLFFFSGICLSQDTTEAIKIRSTACLPFIGKYEAAPNDSAHLLDVKKPRMISKVKLLSHQGVSVQPDCHDSVMSMQVRIFEGGVGMKDYYVKGSRFSAEILKRFKNFHPNKKNCTVFILAKIIPAGSKTRAYKGYSFYFLLTGS
jgi:hypothetical protein